MDIEAVKYIPEGCEFLFYSMAAMIGTLTTAVIFLFLRVESLYKKLVKFAGKATDALEVRSKLM